MEHPFGIDFGGTGIKGAPVDLERGDFVHDRVRIDTPRPATPDAVAEVFRAIVGSFPVRKHIRICSIKMQTSASCLL